jgi:carboxypeptidase Taq
MNPNLLVRMQELRDLSGLVGLATWDQETYLPKKAHDARAAQLGTLQALYHERLVDPRLGEWLDRAEPASEDEQAMVRVLTQERERAVRIPSRLVKALALAQSNALAAWREAREHRSYPVFEPALAALLVLRREQADLWGHQGERYDALLEAYEPGMKTARLLPVLGALKAKLVPMIASLTRGARPPRLFGGGGFDLEAQWAFTVEILEAMGFDFEAGRQDKSVHPFTGGTHQSDVRLTNRFSAEDPLPAIFSALHEGGHGLFEQGFDPSFSRTSLAQAPSMGLHESQSRLWENIVGRGRPFWTHFLPRLQARFPQLSGVSLERFLSEVTLVEPSFIRVEADEVTYNLHIVLRTELEVDLVKGTLSTADLEAAWNDKVKAMLDLTVKSPLDGVLQDIHWAWGELGYFPTYALGNLYAASIWRVLEREVGGVAEALARGELGVVREWLRERVHRHGYRLEAEALVERVTGHGLTDRDFIEGLEARYAELR